MFFSARTLADCCLGEHNSFAIRVLQQISQNPGKIYNPCLIYGESSTGKTFLLHQFKQWLKTHHQTLELQWIEPEDFQRNYVDSLRTRQLFRFHDQYKKGVFVMDNVHRLSGRKTMEQFRFLFDELIQNKTQMVFASSCPPKQFHGFPNSLRTRFYSGILVPLKLPDIENRISFIARQCEILSVPTKKEVVHWLAENLECSFLGILKELERLYQCDPFVFLSLQSCQNQWRSPISLERIQLWIENEFQDHPSITSLSEKKRIQQQRNCVCILAHHYAQLSLKSLAQTYAVKPITIKRVLKQSHELLNDPAFASLWEKFKKEFLKNPS